MSCVIALWVDKPFAEIDARYGFTKAAELRSASSPSQDIIILVLRGMENIDSRSRERLTSLKYKLIDVSGLLAEVRSEYSFANEAKVWRNQSFHEMSFLRFLVIEKFFGDSPVLAMDSDIVWRVEPYDLFEKWKSGGSFLCLGSTCMVFIRGTSWYESYRSGFEELAGDSQFGADFKRSHFTGIYHEQALCQYLTRARRMENDTSNFLGHGFQDQYVFSANPLSMRHSVTPPLHFTQDSTGESINGKRVPFWHMQSTFARYLYSALLIPALTGRTHFRVPYERRSHDNPADLAAEMLAHLHARAVKDQVSFSGPVRNFNKFLDRATVYEEFFHGNLAREIFTDEKWWEPGIWASSPPVDDRMRVAGC